MYHVFFIYSSANGHLGCFHVLATSNSAAMSIGVHASYWIQSAQCHVAAWMGGGFGGKCIHENVWLSGFVVYLKLSQHLLISYTLI